MNELKPFHDGEFCHYDEDSGTVVLDVDAYLKTDRAQKQLDECAEYFRNQP